MTLKYHWFTDPARLVLWAAWGRGCRLRWAGTPAAEGCHRYFQHRWRRPACADSPGWCSWIWLRSLHLLLLRWEPLPPVRSRCPGWVWGPEPPASRRCAWRSERTRPASERSWPAPWWRRDRPAAGSPGDRPPCEPPPQRRASGPRASGPSRRRQPRIPHHCGHRASSVTQNRTGPPRVNLTRQTPREFVNKSSQRSNSCLACCFLIKSLRQMRW